MRSCLLVSLLFLALGACSDAATTTTTEQSTTASDVAARWIVAVADGDAATATSLVEPTGFVVVAGVESGLEVEAIDALLVEGVPSESAAGYWSSLRTSFESFSATPLDRVRPSGETPFSLAGTQFAAVELIGPDEEEELGELILRHDGQRWLVDMAATFGPALIGPLRDAIGSLEGDAAPRTEVVLLEVVAPALQAARDRLDDRDLERELTLALEAISRLPQG